jgi:hypothetical protein
MHITTEATQRKVVCIVQLQAHKGEALYCIMLTRCAKPVSDDRDRPAASMMVTMRSCVWPAAADASGSTTCGINPAHSRQQTVVLH